MEEKTEVLIEKIKTGDVEAALLAVPVEEDQLVYEELFTEEFFLALSAGHELAGHKSVSLDDISPREPAAAGGGALSAHPGAGGLHPGGAHGKIRNFAPPAWKPLRQMVAANVGMTLMPAFAIREQEGVVYLPFSGEVTKSDHWVILPQKFGAQKTAV